MGCCHGAKPTETTLQIDAQAHEDYKVQQDLVRMLLLGAGESGKTTLFKQMIRCYGEGFSDEQRRRFTSVVVQNTLTAIQALGKNYDIVLEAGIELPPLSQEARLDVQEIDSIASTDAVDKEVADRILRVWREAAIQALCEHSAMFQLSDSASYMIENLHRFIESGYIPNDTDILHARIKTTGIVETDFKIGDQQFHMMDVGGQKNERKKWMHHFEGVTAVVFVAAVSEYDQMMYEDLTMNRMHDALKLFGEICNSRWFEQTDILLFLNKRDLFEKKVEKVPLSVCFDDWDGFHAQATPDPDDISHKYDFIKAKFQAENLNREKQIYTHITCATDENNVRFVFSAVKDIIVKSMLKKGGLF